MVRVIIIAPAPIIRTGVRAVLHDVPDLAIAGVTGNLATARRWTLTRPPDVLLLAWLAPDPRLLTLLHWVRRHAPQTTALVLVTQCDDGALALLVSAGAAACLSLEQDAAALVHAIRRAARPGWRSDPAQCALAQRWQAEVGGRWRRLTRQERRVARMLAHGQDARTIAATLGVSPKTIEYHLSHLLAKLECASRLEAALWVRAHVPLALLDADVHEDDRRGRG